MKCAGWYGVVFLFGVMFFLHGCAPKRVQLSPLGNEEENQVRAQFRNFLKTRYPLAIDADVHVQWAMTGRAISLSGILRAQAPALFYLRTTDPLGRALYILASDGHFFTFADNREGEGYRGSLDSRYWRQYVPGAIQPEDIYTWLCGRLNGDNFKLVELGCDQEHNYWFILDYGKGVYDHVSFDPQAKVINRHQLVTGSNAIIFDVIYSDYAKGADQWLWPGRIEFRGRDIAGSISVKFEKIYSHGTMPGQSFALQLPSHYKVYQVN